MRNKIAKLLLIALFAASPAFAGVISTGAPGGGGGGGVSSFNTRTGAVTPQSGDYSSFYLPLTGGTMDGAINMGTNNITNGGEISGFVNSGDGTFAYDLGNASLKYAAKFTQNDGAIVQIPTDDYSLYAVAGTGQFAAGFFMDNSNRYQATFGSDETSSAGGFTDGANIVDIANGSQAIAATGNGYTANLADSVNGAAGYFTDNGGINGNIVELANGAFGVYANNTDFGSGAGYFIDSVGNTVVLANASVGIQVVAGPYLQAINTEDSTGTYNAVLSFSSEGAGYAGQFTDGTRTTYIADGTNAITATGNIDATSYSVSGTAGVNCSAGTVSVLTMVVTNGIITHC